MSIKLWIGVYHYQQLDHLFHFIQVAEGFSDASQTVSYRQSGSLIALLDGHVPTYFARVEEAAIGMLRQVPGHKKQITGAHRLNKISQRRRGPGRIPISYTEDGLRLGQWVGSQRNTKKRLSTERISRLENLSGWTWDARQAAWEEGFTVLEKYVAREGHARVPAYHIEEDFNLGQWVNRQRGRKKRHSTERVYRLESLTGWTWNTRPGRRILTS